ncbi:Sec20-domain-containing protein [Suillus fuscotomentosus]|uniref:Sec20-domain-containing protein n=1 Tax=Suillus fuscotomentosus TaxID=1912939 RepID=A0AAD4E340_9AGAM|nr:Sec20-domain-containing protein [Suillus fuscotomentosus]KAG1898655.1 Sec20-domain-containing protein [Suillus fuscotomentosus]
MPPIPTTTDTEALSLIESIERHHNDLSTFQIPRLRACTGSLTTQQACAAEVREDIEGLVRQIEELDVLVDDHRTERARRELRRRVEFFRDSLISLRKDARAAVLASKHAIDSKSRSQREELLRSPAVWPKSTSSSSEKITEDVTKANHDVTEALQRTIGLMQKELERSVMSCQLLESSTATIQSTSTTHDKLDLILGTSKQLITALEKTDWLDRILIISGLVFFGLVVLFIIKQRIVDHGLRIALFWTRIFPSPGSSTRGVVQKAGEVVTSVSAATTGLNVNHVVEDVSSGI